MLNIYMKSEKFNKTYTKSVCNKPFQNKYRLTLTPKIVTTYFGIFTIASNNKNM